VLSMNAAIHEMRNQLCIAIASVEAFLDRKLEPDAARLACVFAALRATLMLVDDLPGRETAANQSRDVTVDVCELISGHMNALEALAIKYHVGLTVAGCTIAHGARPTFFGDPAGIAGIVTNVVINAIRYTPRGGAVHVAFRRDRAGIRFSVSDEGPGIAPGERDRIFERGYRGQSAASLPGSGIGLALVKQFVDSHGGTIAVSAGPHRGAIFTIELPAISRAERSACSPSQARGPRVRYDSGSRSFRPSIECDLEPLRT
jgi:two-component system phosphate regulon sensor histidine kinase PhoR